MFVGWVIPEKGKVSQKLTTKWFTDGNHSLCKTIITNLCRSGLKYVSLGYIILTEFLACFNFESFFNFDLFFQFHSHSLVNFNSFCSLIL